MSELSIGASVLQRYRLVRRLGQGGMGVVYLARMEGAAGFSRPVVIKQLLAVLAGRRDVNEMFAREARILSTLQHPNIVNVLDFGVETQSYVMVLEYVHGYDLQQWSRFASQRGVRLNHEHVLHIGRKVLAALQHAHEARLPDGSPANIVHRDVSLSNVLLDVAAQVKLHDFGIARIEDGGEMVTEAGVFKGKLALAAPEQLQGKVATRQSDLYSAALLLYQLLSGRNPFQGRSEAETIFRIIEHDPPPLSSLRSNLPKQLDEVFERALQKEPEDRFANAAAFADRLSAFCSRPDEVVARELEKQLRLDFAALPKVLGLESLAERDMAWREAQPAQTGAVMPLESFQASPGAAAPPARAVVPALVAPRQSRAPAAARIPAQGPPARGKPFALPLAAGVVALAVLVLTAGRNPRTQTPPGYLVLEAPNAAASSGMPPAPAVAAAPSSEPALPAAPAQGPETTAATPTRGEAPIAPRKAASAARVPALPDPAALTRQFRTHQPEVEACFRGHPEQVAAAGRVSVRFEVDRSGKVTRANLSPPALESTPLGHCLLQLASAARFEPLSQPVAFSIPITASHGANTR